MRAVILEHDGVRDALKNIADTQIPFAVARGLTWVAKDVEKALVHEIADSFDRPTPTTLDSLFVTAATKLSLVSRVGIKNFAGKGTPASKYLAAEIDGGGRARKRFENALQAAGVLPSGYSIVPGAGIKLDPYGNIPPSLITQLLSYFKAFPEMGYRANMTDKRRTALAKGNKKKGVQGVVYFVGRPGSAASTAPLGIWARYPFSQGSAVKPILIFVPSTQYETRFDFFYAGQKAAERSFPVRMMESFNAIEPKR